MVGCLLEIVETLVLTLIIFFVIQTFIAQPYKVQQQSMEHTLEPEQYVLVDKVTPRFDTYKRGDIVVFTPPPDWVQEDGTPFIKRVIGLGGETVEIRDGNVYINGTKINEPYLYANVPGEPPQPTNVSGDEHRWVIAAGDVFLMGDHRSNSADSRVFGEVPVAQIIGRAWLRYWPLNVFGILPTPTYPELARRPNEPTAVNPALAGVALAVVVGAVVAGSAKNARSAILGLIVTLVVAPVLADPLPDPLGLAARLVGAVLAGYLLWVATRGPHLRTGGSLVGWPTDAFLALAAAIVGYASHGLGAPAVGPPFASAAGFALVALAIVPVVTGRDILRVGLGLGLLLGGALLVRTALGGTPDPLEQLLTAGLVATLGGAVAVLAIAARSDGRAGFEMMADTPRRSSHATDMQAPGGQRPRQLRPSMSLVLYTVVVMAFTGLALGLRAHRRATTASGLAGLVVSVVAAGAIVPDQVAIVGGGALVDTAYLRLFLLLGSLVGLGLAVAGLAGGSRRDAPTVTLGDPRPRRR